MIDIHKVVSIGLGDNNKFDCKHGVGGQRQINCSKINLYLDYFISRLKNLGCRALRLNPGHKYTLKIT